MPAPLEAPRRPEDRLARRGGAVELLRGASAVYSAATRLRNALYDRGLLPVERLDTPVISVGNLTVGGTGKTPFVIYLARMLQRRSLSPGILSRGYGRRERGPSDEGRLLARELPEVPIVERPDRVAGGRELERLGAGVIVLDDGFQHRRLARDLDLVLVDATRPFGLSPPPEGGPAVRSVLPRGLLREAPEALARADALVLTRCDQADPSELATLEEELQALAPGRPLLCARHRPVALLGPQGRLPPEALRGREVRLVSGVGNPEAFERSARALGARVIASHRFPDHCAFDGGELAAALAAGGELLVTEKDAVKLEGSGAPFLTLAVELELERGATVLEALLDALPSGRRALERAALHEGLHG